MPSSRWTRASSTPSRANGTRWAIHPWHEWITLADSDFDLLEQCARHEQVLAIGETGMDTLRGGDLEVQAQVYVRHLQVAAASSKPGGPQSVRTAQNLPCATTRVLTDVALVIHGMRATGMWLACSSTPAATCPSGFRFNPSGPAGHPTRPLLIETDDSDVTINEVASRSRALASLR